MSRARPLKNVCHQSVVCIAASFALGASVPARNRTWSPTFGGSCAEPSHFKDERNAGGNRTHFCRVAAGRLAIRPRRLLQWGMREWGMGNEMQTFVFHSPFPIPAFPIGKHPRQALNLVHDLRTVGCNRYTPRITEPTTGFAPAWSGLRDRRLSASSHVGNAGTEGLEPSPTDLETVILPLEDVPVSRQRGHGGN